MCVTHRPFTAVPLDRSPHRAPNTTSCTSKMCPQINRTCTRLLICGASDCQYIAHPTTTCRGFIAHVDNIVKPTASRRLSRDDRLRRCSSNTVLLPININPLICSGCNNPDPRCRGRHSRKKQLDLQTLYNDSTTTPSGPAADQQIRFGADKPNQPVRPPHPALECRLILHHCTGAPTTATTGENRCLSYTGGQPSI